MKTYQVLTTAKCTCIVIWSDILYNDIRIEMDKPTFACKPISNVRTEKVKTLFTTNNRHPIPFILAKRSCEVLVLHSLYSVRYLFSRSTLTQYRQQTIIRKKTRTIMMHKMYILSIPLLLLIGSLHIANTIGHTVNMFWISRKHQKHTPTLPLSRQRFHIPGKHPYTPRGNLHPRWQMSISHIFKHQQSMTENRYS